MPRAKCIQIDCIVLTNFPQLHSQISIRIKLSRKSPALIKYTHEPQKMFGGYSIVNVVILEQLVRRLDQQEL